MTGGGRQMTSLGEICVRDPAVVLKRPQEPTIGVVKSNLF